MKIIKTLISVIGVLVYVEAQAAIIAPPWETLLESNSFSGSITNIAIADRGEWIEEGDVAIGSTFDCDFELYDAGELSGEMSFYAEYTFYGYTRDYSFIIPAGPFTTWGVLNIDSNGTLTADFINGFPSDGLAETFNDVFGGDSGYFGVVLEDYNKPSINGYGRFYWDAVEVDFVIYPPNPVNEPAPWGLLLVGLFVSLIRQKRGQTPKPNKAFGLYGSRTSPPLLNE